MKKRFVVLTFLSLYWTTLQAADADEYVSWGVQAPPPKGKARHEDQLKEMPPEKVIDPRTHINLKFDVGCFRPSQAILRDIYSSGAVYKGEVDGRIDDKLYVFGLGDYFARDGHSKGGHQKTELQLGGVAVGLQYAFEVTDKIRFFVGLGPKYFFFKTNDHTDYLPRKTTKSGLGGIAKAGFELSVNRHWFFEIYADYSYKRMHFHKRPSRGSYFSRAIQVGGASLGGGFGYTF